MLEVLDISRVEVKRMVKRNTLSDYVAPDTVLEEDYILVCYSIPSDYFYDRTTYRIFYPACPSVLDGGNWEYCQKKRYSDFDSEYVQFYRDGSSRIYCYEIWHLVNDFDEREFNRMLYGVVNAALDDVLAIECYERACNLIDESEDDFGLDSALKYVSAFERSYDIARDLMSFYPVTIYRRKSDYAFDLVELRLAGCIENG